MSITLERFGKGTGKVVKAGGGSRLAELSRELVMGLAADAGVVLYRGFAPTLETVSEFVGKHAGRLTLDPARQFFAKNVQKVDAGYDEIGLHCENGTIPRMPDHLWFFCERAAGKGSQTTYCDGVRVWEKLSEETRALVRAHDIRYCRTFEAAAWKRYTLAQHPGLSSIDEVTPAHFIELMGSRPGQVIEPRDNDRVYTEFVLPAARPTSRGQMAFANSLLGPSYNYEPPRVLLDDGSEIPERFWKEIREVTAATTEDVDWEDGDVLLVDNARVMHGRRKIEDTNRSLYVAMSFKN